MSSNTILKPTRYSLSSSPVSSSSNLYTNLFDNDINTYANYSDESSHIIMSYIKKIFVSKIEYAPRLNYSSNLIGATIEGSNDLETWENIYTITDVVNNVITSVEVNPLKSFFYIKFTCKYLHASVLNIYGDFNNTSEYLPDTWIVHNNELINTSHPKMSKKAFIEPYPTSLWVVKDGELTNGLIPKVSKKAFIHPMPNSLWYVNENNILTNNLIPDNVPNLGAACNAKNLVEVKIPNSCKYIGEYAFNNTQLTHIEIPYGCKFYSTSFPKESIIEAKSPIYNSNFITEDGKVLVTLDNYVFTGK
jgi:hypothetical protein